MGVPGSGKSEWLVNYCINCLRYGMPFILIDPKFDSQKRLIESIPDEYLKNVDLLDLGDLKYPPALNIFRRRKNRYHFKWNFYSIRKSINNRKDS